MYRARPELPAFYAISLVACLLSFTVRIFQVGQKNIPVSYDITKYHRERCKYWSTEINSK